MLTLHSVRAVISYLEIGMVHLVRARFPNPENRDSKMYIADLRQPRQLGQLRKLIIPLTCYARQDENSLAP
jgi:hypothetical protein